MKCSIGDTDLLVTDRLVPDRLVPDRLVPDRPSVGIDL